MVLLERLTTLLRWSLDRQPSPADLWGISLSIPGSVPATAPNAIGDFRTTTPPAAPAWEGLPLIEMLTRNFGVQYGCGLRLTR